MTSTYPPARDVVNVNAQLNVSSGITCSEMGTAGEEFTDRGHNISAILSLEKDRVIVKFTCSHCEDILGEKVLFELPKSKKKEKCLARMVKGDK